jgi:hypothetical protein
LWVVAGEGEVLGDGVGFLGDVGADDLDEGEVEVFGAVAADGDGVFVGGGRGGEYVDGADGVGGFCTDEAGGHGGEGLEIGDWRSELGDWMAALPMNQSKMAMARIMRSMVSIPRM